jgi:putative YjhG/YagF family dehydratase
MPPAADLSALLDCDPALLDVPTSAAGPAGSLPLTEELLRQAPSGDLFGWTQDVGMGWSPIELGRREFLLLSTAGGVRNPDGSPAALGYHTGHWEVNLLVKAAADELRALGCIPFAGFCTDPCDGRSQGTPGMMDSLPYRNDAAVVLRRLIRSLPTRKGIIGVATCDKGLPAMMMALAAGRDLPGVLVPGGVTLPPSNGEDAGKVQTIGARFAHGELTLEQAAELGCRACASPGGGCQFLGTAATSQVVGEALGLCLPHSALAPSGQPIWLDGARRSARAVARLQARGLGVKHIPPRPPCATPWSSTPPLAAPPTCCSTSRPSPTTPACAGPRWRTGAPSTAGCRASSMPCPTGPWAIRPCASSWPAACRRSCCTCAGWGCWRRAA